MRLLTRLLPRRSRRQWDTMQSPRSYQITGLSRKARRFDARARVCASAVLEEWNTLSARAGREKEYPRDCVRVDPAMASGGNGGILGGLAAWADDHPWINPLLATTDQTVWESMPLKSRALDRISWRRVGAAQVEVELNRDYLSVAEVNMTDSPRPDLPRLLVSVWGELMMQKRFQSAALVALLGYFLSREQANEELETGSMPLMFKAVEELRDELHPHAKSAADEQPACSFCGRGEPEVRLAAGARAFICDACVATLTEVFGTKPNA